MTAYAWLMVGTLVAALVLIGVGTWLEDDGRDDDEGDG